MEKLQAALERARQSRQDTLQPRQGTSASVPPPPSDIQQRWMDLKQITVKEQTLEKHRLVTKEANTKATPFDILRTKTLLQMRQNGWKRIGITSPMPNSGKTTMACNLALGLGRQRDLRSMVLDLDLRDPSVQEFLDYKPEHGIEEVLSGEVSFADQAVRIGDNVAVSMATGPERDPARLLLAEKTADVIDEIDRAYAPDILLFDLPSLLVNDDTRAFLKNVDCALIVIRANKTHYSQFDVCEREIAEQTNVLGVVLNAFQ